MRETGKDGERHDPKGYIIISLSLEKEIRCKGKPQIALHLICFVIKLN